MNYVVKVEHVNPFITATMETYKSMMKSEIRPGKVALVKAAQTHFDVTGVIGLSGGAQGTVALGFPRITALKSVSAFVGEKVLALNSVVVDAVGELANIVAGAAKRDLVKYKISISLPSVILGENHELAGPKDVIPLMVPFESEFGSFSLLVSFKSEIV